MKIYRIIAITVVLLLSAKAVRAQRIGMNIGYQGTYISMQNMADMITRYNDSRSWLTTKMKNPVLYHGLEGGINFRISPKNTLFLQYTHSRATGYAEGVQMNNQVGSRDLRLRFNKLSFMTNLPLKEAPVSVRAGVGFGNYSTITRVNSDPFRVYDQTAITSLELAVVKGLAYKEGKGLQLKFQAGLPLARVSFYALGEQMDGVNFGKFVPADYRGTPFNVSLGLLLNLSVM